MSPAATSTIKSPSLRSFLNRKAAMGAARIGLFTTMIAGFVFSLYFLVFSAALGLPFLGGLSLLGAISTMPLFPRRATALRLGSAALALVLCALFLDAPARELDAKVRALAHQSRTHGAATWTGAETFGLQMLSRTMAVGGALAGYPEVAAEHRGMHDGNGGDVRAFVGDFPASSPTLVDFACGCDVQNAAPREKSLFFDPGRDGLRYNLAFNGSVGRVVRKPDGRRVELDIAIRYRAESQSELFAVTGLAGGSHRFVIDEGVYAGLEDLGRLHRYVARWTWSVSDAECQAMQTTSTRSSRL